LTTGTTYKFKVEARNEYGYSDYSDTITILVAAEPSQISTPTTTTLDSNVVVSWTAPSANGSPITSFTILIQQSDSKYSEEVTYCDGTLPAIIAATTCSIPLSVLTADPYSLE
jgi:hypothetical protein